MSDARKLTDEQSERLVDLLIQQATLGLSETEQQELDKLNSSGNQHEPERFEAAAAAFDLSLSAGEEANPTIELPSHVRDQLLISAGQFFAEAPDAKPEVNESPNVERPQRESSQSSSFRWRELLMLGALAASLLLVISGFNPFAEKEPAVASVIERMNQFVSSAPTDLVDIVWQPVHDKDAGGKVLWSDSKQEGFMVFKGMDVNNPTTEQYQLWIFDTDPAQAVPVDGGVFDITAANVDNNGNVIVPFKPTVPVDRAVQFAVTVERPGGVYQSKREKIPVLATVKQE